MSLSSRLGRLAAAATLVASGATVTALVSTAPVSAADTAITINCAVSPDYNPVQIGNGDTVTFTIGTDCSAVQLQDDDGTGTMTVNGSPATPGVQVPVSQGDTVVFTAPATGSSRNNVSFTNSSQGPSDSYVITFPLPSGSLVDNGDGSMTFTYQGAVVTFVLTQGSVCTSDTGSLDWDSVLYILDGLAPGIPGALGPSPVVISAGSEVMSGQGPQAATVESGIYQACMYFWNQDSQLQQSLEVGLGEIVPTTTTTAADDPVTPAYTG